MGYSPSLGSQDSLTLHPALRGRGTSEVTQRGRAAVALLPWKAPPTLRVQVEDKAPEKVSDLPKVTQLFALKPKLGSYVRSQG